MLRRTGASILAGALPVFFIAFAAHADPAFTRAHPVTTPANLATPDTATPTTPPASTETPAPDASTSPPATATPDSATATPPAGSTAPAAATTPARDATTPAATAATPAPPATPAPDSAATTPPATPDATSPPATPAVTPTPPTTPTPDSAATTPPSTPGATSPPATPAATSTPPTTPAPDSAAATPPPAPVDPIISNVRSALADKSQLKGLHEADRTALAEFYDAPNAAPLWVTSSGLSEKGKALIAEIRKADDWGLSASSFDVPELASGQTSPSDLAGAERRASIAALKYARFARGGRFDPGSLVRSYDQKPPVRDPKVVMSELSTASAPDEYLRGLHPKHEQFTRLRKALLALRAEDKPQDPAEAARHVVIPRGPVLRPGAESPNVALLRQRLGVTAEAGNENVYDDALVTAVEAFQTANGLQADGIVGGGTRGALNGEIGVKPNKERDIARILVNMERWRWMPEHLGQMYVWDNLPEFMTRVMKDGKELFTEKIVVGQASWPTPVFSADMKFIVFNPSWGMPDGIKQKELLPRLRRYSSGSDNFFEQMFGGGGPNAADVIEAQDLIVTYNGRQIDPNSVNWSQVNIRAYSFTQPPGPRNVLGRLKFMFPNKHDVYMHDTVQKDLFSRRVRNYSHGCMRVQNPLRFAEVLLGEDKGWSADKVRDYYHSSAQANVNLDKPIPVHVTYFTAVVGDDGAVKTYGDVYGHDSRISSALLGRSVHFDTPRGGYDDEAEIASSDDDYMQPERRRSREARNTRKQRPPQTLSDIFSSLYGP